MRTNLLLTKALIVVALLLGGVSSVWADNVYTILYGTPIYDTDGITIIGVSAQTDFTNTDGTTASNITSSDANGSNCTNAMPIGGSVLYSGTSFSKSFNSPATKGTVHFEANYTATTNGQETWKVVDSKGTEIFGTTDCGFSNGNADKTWGFCNGVSLGTNWFRQARSTHNRVILDINIASKKVSYTVLVSSGNNSYSTLTGTYDLPSSVSDVAGLTATTSNYHSYMDNVSFYNLYDNTEVLYNYTINYTFGEATVKTVKLSSSLNDVITAEMAIDGEGEYAGNHYLITATEAPSMTLTSGENILNVPVRAPYTATLNVTRTIGGVAQTPVVTNLVETDAKVCAWRYTYPLYVEKDGIYYIADVTTSFGESGAFTDGQIINKTVAYTSPDYDVVYFGEPNEVAGTNSSYSNGSTGYITGGKVYSDNSVIRLGTLPAGTYHLITNVADAANRNVVVGDCTDTSVFPTALVTITTTGEKDEVFTLTAPTPISISGKDQGSGKFNQSATIDYILVKTESNARLQKATIGLNGYTTFASPLCLDLAHLPEGLAAYTATLTETTLSFAKCTEAVAAGTGLLLAGTGGETYYIPVVTTGTTLTGNAMTGVTTTTNLKSDETNYIFAMKKANSATDELLFAPLTSTKNVNFPAGKAYITVPANAFGSQLGARALVLTFDDATSVKELKNSGIEELKAYYNLQGQRVASPKKGLYIVNGRKVQVK